MMKSFAGVVFTLLFGACGVSVGSHGISMDAHSDKHDDSFSYHYSENGCDTGEHSFSSKKEYCDALKNESLNQGCAPRLRLSAGSKDCD